MRTLLLFLSVALCTLTTYSQGISLTEQVGKYIKEGKYKQAADFITETQAINPDSAEVLLSTKAYCEYKLKKHKEARGLLAYIEDNDISDSVSDVLNLYYACFDGNSEELAEQCRELMEANPQLFYRQLKILGKNDLLLIAQNIREYTDTQEQEDIPDYKTALAIICFVAEDYKECYNQLSTAVENYPLGISYYIMGRLKARQQEYISATAYYNNAEAIGYKPLSLYKDRSIAKGFNNDFKGAIEDLDICIEHSNSDELYCLRAICYIRLLQYDKALSDLNTAISINDTIAQYYNQRGIIFTNTGNYAEAVMNFQTALKYDANLNYIHNNLAIALEKAGFKEQAVEHYKINLKRHPDYADSYFNLGRIAYSEGNYKQAVKLLSKANDLNPKFSDTQYILGLAYMKSGKREQGCFYLNMAVENGNSSAPEAIETYCNSVPEEQNEEE